VIVLVTSVSGAASMSMCATAPLTLVNSRVCPQQISPEAKDNKRRDRRLGQADRRGTDVETRGVAVDP
jgi:hypothetical protein